MAEVVQATGDSPGVASGTLLEECSGRVLLSVGGVKFETSLQTLRAVPDSDIAKSFNGNWRSFRNNSETVLIDRRGDVRGRDSSSERRHQQPLLMTSGCDYVGFLSRPGVPEGLQTQPGLCDACVGIRAAHLLETRSRGVRAA